MFEFKGTTAVDSTVAEERDWRGTNHQNIQHPGTRSVTPTLLPAPRQTSLRHRALTEDVGRPNLLQKRSRNNTSIGSLSPCEGSSLLPAMSLNRSTSRSSADRRSVSGSIHTRSGGTESFGKTLMTKGSRLLKRQNSKQDLTSLHTLDGLAGVNGGERVQGMSTRPGSRQSGIQSRLEDGAPKYNISGPFNFQHLTHTTPHQLRKIGATSHDDLVSEFSAIRAAQAPRCQLQGIKTTEICEIKRGGSYSEASGSETPSRPGTGCGPSPPRSPEQPQDQWHNGHHHHPTSPTRSLHQPSRSIESFSQPSPRRRSPQMSPGHTSPTSPPPRASSRNAVAPDSFAFHQDPPTNTPFEHHVTEPQSPPHNIPIRPWDEGSYDLSSPHAVTTPDNTAHSLKSLPFSMIRTELTGVPEEDETSEGRRSSITTARSPTPTLRHVKSFPSSRMSPQRWSSTLSMPSEDVEGSRARLSTTSSFSLVPPLFTDEHNEDLPTRPLATRRASTRLDDSWEDVIDYCYEHEAEADCNFDWDYVPRQGCQDQGLNAAVDDSIDGNTSRPKSKGPNEYSFSPIRNLMMHSRSSSNYSQSSQPALLPLPTSLPELDLPSATSAESSFSSIPEVVTPSQPIGPETPPNSSNSAKRWPDPSNASPLVMLNEDSPVATIQDDLYNHIFSGEFVQSDHHFPWIFDRVAGSTISNSPRSSRSQISKSSSQESFRHSAAFSAAQQRRQRNTSVGSLPELIPGRTSRERVDQIVEKLADHVSILDTSDAPVVPVPSNRATAEDRRRNSKLAKEVALKSIISRALTDEEVPEVPLPLHPAFRERLGSDSTPLPVDTSIPMPPLLAQGAVKKRMRSPSSVSSLTSARASRASYSLFPPTPPK